MTDESSGNAQAAEYGYAPRSEIAAALPESVLTHRHYSKPWLLGSGPACVGAVFAAQRVDAPKSGRQAIGCCDVGRVLCKASRVLAGAAAALKVKVETDKDQEANTRNLHLNAS